MSEISQSQQDKSQQLRDSLAKDFNEEKAKEFASLHKDKRWYNNFILLYEMITCKEYKISNKTKLLIAGTLAYVVLPIDVIPDFLPVVGWLDDIYILNLTMNALSEEIKNFKAFKEA